MTQPAAQNEPPQPRVPDGADATLSIVPPPTAGALPPSAESLAATAPLLTTAGWDGARTAETADLGAVPRTPGDWDGGFAAYRMEHLLGRGGMGEVWAAEQVSLGRRVAVKRVIPRVDDTQALARIVSFRHEAHIAGLLEHPNIVPVHDLGHDGEANPLLVMKLVEGRPWCDALDEDWDRLSPDEFLSRHIPILMAMTQAVAFAHSRGIVHRDLKPSQVMVGAFGEVLLTDWGLAMMVPSEGATVEAKRRTARWDVPTPGTASNPAGTPALMAPEQTCDGSHRIGFWTDVYLLGGTLYFLLTGHYPHSGSSSREAMERAARGIVVPPSQRAPGRAVPPDLEALCLAALQASPEERIGSAQAFWQALDDHVRGSSRRAKSRELTEAARSRLTSGAADYSAYAEILAIIEEARRLWSDNPACDGLKAHALGASVQQALANGDLALARLQAGGIPDPAAAERLLADVARAEAAVRRRQAQFRAAVAALFVLMGVVAVGSLAFTSELRAKNAQLERTTNDAVEARKRAEENLAIADRQGSGAFQMVNFVLRDLKAAMDGELRADRGIRVPVANEISHAIAGRVASPVLEYFQSVPVEEAMEWPRELRLARAAQMFDTGERFRELGRFGEAAALTSATLALRERTLGGDAPETGASAGRLGSLLMDSGNLDVARPLLERSLAIAERAAESDAKGVMIALSRMAALLVLEGKAAPAIELYQRALDLAGKAEGSAEADAGSTLSNIGTAYERAGDMRKALEYYTRAAEVIERAAGPESPAMARALANVSGAQAWLGNAADAKRQAERCLSISEKALGPEHPDTAASARALARLLTAPGEIETARGLYARALAIQEKSLGPEHPETARTMHNLAAFLAQAGETTASMEMARRSLAARERAFGADHATTAQSVNQIASLLRQAGRLAEALPYARRSVAIAEKSFGPDHPLTATALSNLAAVLNESGDHAAALPCNERTLAIYEKSLGPDHEYTVNSAVNVGYTLALSGDRRAAKEFLARYLAKAESSGGAASANARNLRAEAFRNLAELAAEQPPAEAAATSAEAVALIAGYTDDEDNFGRRSRLLYAECLIRLERRGEARELLESLIAGGYASSTSGMKAEDRARVARACEAAGTAPPR